MDEAPRSAWWRRYGYFAGVETLKYEPLDIEKEEIRLITLLPGEAGIVKCRLENISLDANPTYQALSYCWGNAEQTKKIIVNECAVDVTANLEEALRRLRVSDPGSYIWIDALCIDQRNIYERDRQVLRMRDIYSKAKCVTAWIGEEVENTSSAITYLEAVADGKEPWAEEKLQECLVPIFGRPYWRRTWIVQEIVLAPNVHIVSGSYSFPWEILEKAMCTYVIEDPYDNSMEAVTQLVSLRRSFGKGHEMKLLDALNRTVLLKATDLKDKIFALLSLTSDGPSIIPSPDYNSSIHSIVGVVVRGIAASEMTLDVLAAKMPWEEPSNSRSWYPHWNLLWKSPAHAQERYEACQKAIDIRATGRSEFPFEVTRNIVMTYGIELDMIHSIGLIYTRTNFTHPNSHSDSEPLRYLSAPEVFMNLDSCLFITEKNSPNRWMFLAVLFTFHGDDIEFLSILVRDRIFAEWIISFGDFLVSGRTLREWASNLDSSSEVNHSITRAGLPKLEGSHWIEYRSKLIKWYQRAYTNPIVTQSGRLGLVHWRAKLGDKICLLHAFRNIVILRPWDDTGYKLVGYASVEGMMYGEMDHLLAGDNLQCFQIC
jgi:hypothetical protein